MSYGVLKQLLCRDSQSILPNIKSGITLSIFNENLRMDKPETKGENGFAPQAKRRHSPTKTTYENI
jgi:hypothetical protein